MNYAKIRKILSITLPLFMIGTMLLGTSLNGSADTTANTVGVTYRVNVQNDGWQAYMSDGQTAGTQGQSKRLETLEAKLSSAPTNASITYQAYVQSNGWMSAVSNGADAGTVNQGKRIEAIRMTLSGVTGYEVQYRVHQQTYGWSDWMTTKNNTDIASANAAGQYGSSKRVEAVEIKLVATSVITPAKIQSISPINITTITGTAPTLPSMVTAVMSDGTTKSVSVVWDSISPSSYATAGTFTISGTIAETTTVKATAVISVFPSANSPAILSVNPVNTSTTTGKSPILPSEVTAILSDGTTEQVPVVWETINPSSYANTGAFTVKGTIAASASVSAIAIVTVTTASATATVISINPINVITMKGSAPDLPSSVTASMNDGTTKNFTIVWYTVDPTKYANAGMFTATGLLCAPNTPTITANVTVISPSAMATVVSITPVRVVTRAGTVPDMPTLVSATMNDGTTRNFSVTWDSIVPSKYNTTGTFVVNGKIPTSSTVKALAIVTVG